MERERAYTMGEGMLAGVVGYATVAVIVGTLDLALGRGLFFTPALLGRELLAGSAPEEAAGAVEVLVYNGLHLFVFLVIGAVVVQLARFVEVHPAAWYCAFFVCVLGFFAAEFTLAVIDPAALPWWAVLVATAGAAWAMGLFINYRHPALRASVEHARR